MSTPNLSRQVTLEAPSRTTDGAGGYTSNWTPLGTLWAEILPGTGSSTGRGGLMVREQRLAITVRGAPYGAQSRPVPGQRFREGGRIFMIDGVTEQDATGRYLICSAREEIAS